MEKNVSIVIPAYNGRGFLEKNLPHILSLDAAQIIVVNDASPDDVGQFLSQSYPQLKVITHAKNLGFPVSVNEGFAVASTEYVLLLNQDTNPDPDLLKCSLPHFSQNPRLFAVTFNDGENSWAKASFVKGFIQYGNGEPKTTHASFWSSGAASLFKKSIWNQLAGLDNLYSPGYFEDQDLGYRAHKSGFEIIWDPRCRISHSSPGSTFSKTYSSSSLNYIKERNYLLMHWKNLDFPNLISHIFFLSLKNILAPGFIIPTFMALTKFFPLLVKRFQNKFTHSDSFVFSKFKST